MSDETRIEATEEKEEGNLGRRRMLGLMAGAAMAAPFLGAADAMAGEKKSKKTAAAGMKPGAYTLPPLPYAYDALDGYLSSEILHLHHDKHHAGYVRGLNKTLESMSQARSKGDFAQVKALERSLAFNGSGHVLHSIYWNSMSPKGGGAPEGALKTALEASFGSVDGFRKHFAAATKAAEASAWGILAYEPLGDRLVILASESHENFGFQGSRPLLCCDVWEHAYYLKYQSDRGAYVDKFFDVINWDYAAEQLEAARGAKKTA